jgi:anthranilate phosphoribosyltransferase
MRAILAGEDTSPRKDVVLLNATAALATTDIGFEDALQEARHSLESGAALACLQALVCLSQRLVNQQPAMIQ